MGRSLAIAAIAAVIFVLAQGAAAACQRGVNGCAKCNVAKTKCEVCQSGYGRHPAGTCHKCGPGCTRCSGLNPARCTACKPKHYLKGFKCYKCPRHCVECEKGTGKCLRCKPPTWDADAYSWAPVYGKTSAGTCVLCQPQGNHAGWCSACKGDKPKRCTKCTDFNNGFPMYLDTSYHCQFCTALHGDKCLKCRNGDGKCIICADGWVPDGAGSCKTA
ncbi:hypothetical protein CHLNCDRAFT_139611 [Chlorella variabilis]|uniref:TNFR-Cys domain-containing protein n=1 Tax=Chlorella variabilis TaxID=554065 RepID=E1ZQJ0_CHLVA|nr:hypothetical protein CHLNCDRAFT_139611 [Chlorella variabilis]EFN51946.1 hypothetical protein CHLNCDRAFT_139611 [Chlorella variabilis]|eukprot:XP_005844048.1 hypothetical protein CHLNCDRAFT_139611 [Chlorella variabilis]